MPRYTIVCEWSDSGEVEDADEVVVVADSPASALAKARKKWRMTIGAEWPQCRLLRSFLLTPERRAEFA